MPPDRPPYRVLLLSTVCALVLVAGCGRKGPLYLPPPPPADAGQAQPTPPEAEPESAPKSGQAGG